MEEDVGSLGKERLVPSIGRGARQAPFGPWRDRSRALPRGKELQAQEYVGAADGQDGGGLQASGLSEVA